MRIATLTDGVETVIAVWSEDGWHDTGRVGSEAFLEILVGGEAAAKEYIADGRVLGDNFEPTLPYRPPRNVMCLGKNYAEHAAEFAAFNNDADVIPKAPIIFTKAASALCGPTDDIVVDAALANALDYETELAVIIGKTGRGIPAEEAGEYIAGYTVINDLTARDLQAKHAQWFLAKSLPAASPLGPVVVTPEELTPRGEQQLSTLVNGELRQSARLAEMITSIETAIETISGIVGLEAGDMIAMGTPSGVAVSFDPPKYLVSGDEVRSEISRIGSLANRVDVRP